MQKKLNKHLIKIVTILNDYQYHDGSTLGEKLKITRSAVWKIIKKLQHYGIQMDSVKGKGYALLEPLTLLNAAKIKKNIEHNSIDIHLFESIHSTSDYLKTVNQHKKIVISLAEQQTKGRGRLQREWYSPFGKNIYFSCLYHFHKDVSELAGLSLVVSLAVFNTLKSYGLGDLLRVKWPNDIIYDNKKLSGSLIDVQAETHGVSHVVIGIGINVNMLNEEANISQAWTSMQKILGRSIDRNALCIQLINQLMSHLNKFNAHGFSHFLDEWMESDCLIHQGITLQNLAEKVHGKVAGVSEHGHLLLQLANGTIQTFSSGDAFMVRKV